MSKGRVLVPVLADLAEQQVLQQGLVCLAMGQRLLPFPGVTGLLIAGVWASEAGWLGVKLSSKVFGCRLQV